MKFNSRLKLFFAVSLVAGLALSCGQRSVQSKPKTPGVYHFSLSILPGEVVGKPGWPFYSPANFTLPPDSDVVISITNYDSGTDPVPPGKNSVSGTVENTEMVNGKAVSSLGAGQVSHTFSIEKLKLNVVVPPFVENSGPGVVVFRFHTPGSGTYPWQCWAACGSGKSGWEGAMSAPGYMTGTLTVSDQ